MCIVEQRTYVQPDGRKETFDHVKSRCQLAGAGRTCRQITYEERTMQGAGHSRHSPHIRYADESSSPATESFPATPVNGATFVEVTPTSAGVGPHPSPKHRKTGSLGQIVFNLGSKKEKEKEKQKEKSKVKTKRYHGSSAASEATSSSSIRSYSPAPPSPLSVAQEQNLSPTYQHSHRRSYSATIPSKPSLAYATTARATRRLSASLNHLHANAQHGETEDEHQARIERERATGREQLRRERQADEYWAQYHRNREERREESRRMNEQSRNVDDWEARLEEGRRRVEQERTNRQPEERHDPSVDAVAPADSSGDEDWEAQLEEGRRRLAELRRTGEAAASNAHTSNQERRPSQPFVDNPLRRRNTTGGQRYHPSVPLDASSTSRSNSSANATASSSIGADTAIDREATERERLHAFERQQMVRERVGADAMLASQIADAEAEIRRAEIRLATRRERDYRERMVEGNYGAYTYERLNPGAPPTSDFYNPRAGMGELRHENRRLPAMTHQGTALLGEYGWERGQRVISEARGGGRRSRRSSVSYHQHRHRRDEQR
ncbi:hypothetical protein SLS58_010098 [Diplodia intermedia]|uniref:Uncharacterized protein n=1 Tax=Diplodia intermedia TaxID=856260 RepID=A0ABR3T873_9PEZI